MIGLPAGFASGPAWLKAGAIIAGTFVLEDAATVLAAVAVRAGEIGPSLALGALWTGVASGDVGLYGLGAAGARWPRLRRFLTLPGRGRAHEWFTRNVVRAVAISRFVPGARLPVYIACGFFRAPFLRFTVTAVLATLVWTSLLFALSLRIGGWLLARQGEWRWIGLAGFVLTILAVGRLIAHFQTVSPKA